MCMLSPPQRQFCFRSRRHRLRPCPCRPRYPLWLPASIATTALSSLTPSPPSSQPPTSATPALPSSSASPSLPLPPSLPFSRRCSCLWLPPFQCNQFSFGSTICLQTPWSRLSHQLVRGLKHHLRRPGLGWMRMCAGLIYTHGWVLLPAIWGSIMSSGMFDWACRAHSLLSPWWIYPNNLCSLFTASCLRYHHAAIDFSSHRHSSSLLAPSLAYPAFAARLWSVSSHCFTFCASV